jgi:VWFA-related protein
VTRSILAAIAGIAFVVGASASAQRRSQAPPSGDLVELDLVASDKQGRPVTDLRKDEFQIKEDGHVMEVKTFAHVTALGSADRDDGRSVVLLLDDIGIPMGGTSGMQQIAQVLLSPAGHGDEVSVIRLSSRTDEAFGDFQTARDRIDGYHGGAVPFSPRETYEGVLKAIAKTARQLEAVEHRRKAIICLGVRAICDFQEPARGNTSFFWSHWVAAMSATARANVGVYAVDPTGANGSFGPRDGGMSDVTGGEMWANTNEFARIAATIWKDASHYYLLGYWPSTDRREIHSIDVKVTRKDVRVRARKRRAD